MTAIPHVGTFNRDRVVPPAWRHKRSCGEYPTDMLRDHGYRPIVSRPDPGAAVPGPTAPVEVKRGGGVLW